MHDPVLEDRIHSILTRETGPLVLSFLDDPDMVEVMVNPDGRVWTDRHSSGLCRTDFVEDPARVERLLRAVAALENRDLGVGQPTLEVQIGLYNVRVAAVLPIQAERSAGETGSKSPHAWTTSSAPKPTSSPSCAPLTAAGAALQPRSTPWSC